MTPSRRVRNLRDVQKGDHIKWKRTIGYDHHGIVKEVDYKSGKVHVIEYGSEEGKCCFTFSLRGVYEYVRNIYLRVCKKSDAVVRSIEVDGVNGMHKHVYSYDGCYDADKVVEIASSKLDVKEYKLFKNNCEHFATECKTGEKHCSQKRAFDTRAGIAVAEGVGGGCGTATSSVIATCAAQAAKNGTTIIGELRSLVCGGTKNAVKAIWKAVVNGRKAVGMKGLKMSCSGALLGITTVAIEGCLFGYNCYKACKNYNGNIKGADDEMVQYCKRQKKNDIIEAACESVGALGGTAVGAALGSFIPFVGTAIGAFLGNCVGRFIGRVFGRWFFK